MYKRHIAKVALPGILNKEFDYTIGPELAVQKGMRVLVDFRGKKRVGLVCATAQDSFRAQLKPVIKQLDPCALLVDEHFQFAHTLSTMYPYAYSEFLFMMLPASIKSSRRQQVIPSFSWEPAAFDSQPLFVKADYFEQRYAYWKEMIQDKLQRGSVLVCFPQLSYLREAWQRFEKDFPRGAVVLHSHMSQRQLAAAWMRSRQRTLILGSRVSLFYYPLDLQLLIIEQENSPYYFQEEKPYHQLFDVALALAKLKGVRLIASGDYPSLTAYHYIRQKKMELTEFSSQAVPIEVISRERSKKANIISPVALELLRKGMNDHERLVVLWNKKGFSRVTACSHCKHVYTCQRCSGFLQLNNANDEAVCPHCHSRLPVPKICPHCKNGYIQTKGWGVERLGIVLRRLFPLATIDSWGAHSVHSQIILATPRILGSLYTQERFHRGLDLDADSHLMHMDYNATFNAYLYFKQVSLLFESALYLFTSNRAYYLFDYLNGPWQAFYEKELSLRRKLKLPPYGYLIKITLRSPHEKSLLLAGQSLYNRLCASFGEVHGPLKEYPFRVRDQFRYAVIVKAQRNVSARAIIKKEISSIHSRSVRVAAVVA